MGQRPGVDRQRGGDVEQWRGHGYLRDAAGEVVDTLVLGQGESLGSRVSDNTQKGGIGNAMSTMW